MESILVLFLAISLLVQAGRNQQAPDWEWNNMQLDSGLPQAESPEVETNNEQTGSDNIEEALQWLRNYNEELNVERPIPIHAAWNYTSDLTEEKKQILIQAQARFGAFEKRSYEAAQQFNWRSFEQQNETVFREFAAISDIGTAVLDTEDLNKLDTLVADMETIYSVAQVCNRPGFDPEECFALEPDLTEIQKSSTDWEEQLWAWRGWRNVSGAKMPDMYEQYVALQNKAAIENGFSDAGANWRQPYEDPNFEDRVERLWNQVRPLYVQLHAYVRRKLMERYQANINMFSATGHIPAHITGDMWAQTWEFLEGIARPNPNQTGVDVTDEMVRQGFTARRMFELSEEFFTSLGYSRMPDDFYDKSIIEKPEGRDIVCHASAWDFYDGQDFRIKQCTEVNMAWLLITHHEMGHVAYFQQYKDLPIKFRGGANPGFHEAIGDVLALSVATPEHLEKIGLLTDYNGNAEIQMNFLMQQALFKVAFLPFGILVDQWRWSVFKGRTTIDQYNTKWWELRCRYQGVAPPVGRTNRDFDPGAKYHIPANVPYVRYFIASILQFQFHKAMCEAAGHTGPVHTCDIYQSTDAGKLLGDAMKLGSSKPWRDALEMIDGQRDYDASALMEYFSPLLEWLQEQNAGQPIGWDENCPAGTFAADGLNEESSRKMKIW